MAALAAPLARLERIEAHMDRHGLCLYAVELRETGQFIGFVGMAWVPFEAHFTPAVEIGWRLDQAFWNRGLATEGARECLRHAFEALQLPEVVAMTAPGIRCGSMCCTG